MSKAAPKQPIRYCGRVFSEAEIESMRALIAVHPQASRAELSRRVCDRLGWKRVDGRSKEMSCRVAMLRMHEDGLIGLPPPRNRHHNGRPRGPVQLTFGAAAQEPLCAAAGALGKPQFRIVNSPAQSSLWNELIESYHYLGYRPLGGAQMRYLVYARQELVGALGFAGAAWKVACRDAFIGWTPGQRSVNLAGVVNNARFLILPWVRSPNLASRILGGTLKRLPEDWRRRYGYRPVLLETFVLKERFRGTCYRAANWKLIGQTRGRGKWDREHNYPLGVKDMWVYPLHKNFREILCSENFSLTDH